MILGDVFQVPSVTVTNVVPLLHTPKKGNPRMQCSSARTDVHGNLAGK